jgi:hypothetical protein
MMNVDGQRVFVFAQAVSRETGIPIVEIRPVVARARVEV